MKGLLDPTRAALCNALGLAEGARRLLVRVPDTGGLAATLRSIVQEITARLDRLPVQDGLALEAGAQEPAPRGPLAVELDWRVAEVERVHLGAYKQFKEEAGLKLANGSSSFPPDLRRVIRQALRDYDGDLLGFDARDRWKKESRVRAAGVGIFFDPTYTGDFRAHGQEQPADWRGPYLEHDRPWRKRSGKRDPILHFAALYFEQVALREG
jgi:hypothetical protein